MRKTDIGDLEYTWKEWEMMNRDQESAIDIPGETYFFIYFFKILANAIYFISHDTP